LLLKSDSVQILVNNVVRKCYIKTEISPYNKSIYKLTDYSFESMIRMYGKERSLYQFTLYSDDIKFSY